MSIPRWASGVARAPSAHNTQPWRLRLLADGGAEVHFDPARTIPNADPSARDLWLGIGAAVEAGRLAAAVDGLGLTWEPMRSADVTLLGRLVPAGAADHHDAQLGTHLDERRTGRGAHLEEPLPPGLANVLRDEADRAGLGLAMVTGPELLRRLGRLARTATATGYADPAMHAELWRWLRLDPAEATSADGLTAQALELRGASLAIARAALPPDRMRMLARAGAHRLLTMEAEMTVRRSASVWCLTGPPRMRRDAVIEAGRTLLRLWLHAAPADCSTHPISALIDTRRTARPTLACFGLSGTPLSVFRLGRTERAPARSGRLPMQEIVEEG